MNRDEIVRISRLAAFGELSSSDVNKVIIQYCIEHGKSYDKVAVFVAMILKNRQLLTQCFNIALNFYEKKFTVYKLWSAPNPLNNQGQERILLQIF